MPNDAKLGMLAGVFGVIIAAMVIAQPQPQPQPQQPVVAESPAKEKTTTEVPETAVRDPPAHPPVVDTPDLASTPVARTNKDVDAQPTSRQPGTEEK
ncbi:MAG: hypothetical protein L0241_10830 [Planctomycetia bacterium]|nr:hypothetical protein [Planctomycetia bacterium]